MLDYWLSYDWYGIVCSEGILKEYERKLLDPKIRRKASKYKVEWTEAQVMDFLHVCRISGEMVEPTFPKTITQAPGDATVVGTALAGKVDALVTWDNDFREDAATVRILSDAGILLLNTDEFMQWLRKRTNI